MLDGLSLGSGFAERFLFPAPDPSYGPQSYKRHLCWIPWNEVISPHRAKDEKCTDGIPCLWFPAPKAATVILFFHANAEDLGMSFAVLKHMRDQFKVNVLSVEYPGYGLLHHMTTNEDGVYEVALTAFRFLVDEVNVRYSQIILFGRSLGSGPAVYLAAQYPVGGLILVNAISSVKAAVQSVAGRLIAWTWRERFPNYKIIANVSCSTLFIHGECDGLLPPEHSLRLFKRCRARKLLITPPKMEHNSNLFGDASFLAVPAIHFFGFPGYYTSTPPRLPAYLFENPERRARLREQMKEESSGSQPWLCGCLAKGDPHHLDVTFCRQEHSVEDITIRFSESPVENNGTASSQARHSASASASASNGHDTFAAAMADGKDGAANIAEVARRETAHFPSRSPPPNTAFQPGKEKSAAILQPTDGPLQDSSRQVMHSQSRTTPSGQPLSATVAPPPSAAAAAGPNSSAAHSQMTLERERLMFQEEANAQSDPVDAHSEMQLPREMTPMPQGDLQTTAVIQEEMPQVPETQTNLEVEANPLEQMMTAPDVQPNAQEEIPSTDQQAKPKPSEEAQPEPNTETKATSKIETGAASKEAQATDQPTEQSKQEDPHPERPTNGANAGPNEDMVHM